MFIARISLLSGILCCLHPYPLLFAQEKPNYCEPPPAMRKQIKQLDEQWHDQFPADRRKAREQFYAANPGDFHVRNWVIGRQRFEWQANPAARIERARAWMEERPNDPGAIYLYAVALIGADTRQALEVLSRLARQFPDFPLTYLELADIHRYPLFKDEVKSRENLKLWAAKCPDSLERLYSLRQSKDPEFLKDLLRRVRRRLAASPDPEDFEYFSHAWSLEFSSKPFQEHAALRRKIADEITTLREKCADRQDCLAALRIGYEQTGDSTGRRWAEDEIIRLNPQGASARGIVFLRWEGAHPRVSGTEGEKWKSFNREMLKAAKEWVKLWPIDRLATNWVYNASEILEEEITSHDFEMAAESYLRALEKNEDTIGSYNTPAAIWIAGAYLRRGIATDRVPMLVQKVLEETERFEQEYRPDDRYEHHPGLLVGKKRLRSVEMQGWPLIAEAYLRLRQPEKAREWIERMSETLKKNDADSLSEAVIVQDNDRARHWQTRGLLAEWDGHKKEALGFYKTALSHHFRWRQYVPGKPDELVDAVRRLLVELNGSDSDLPSLLPKTEPAAPADEGSRDSWYAKRIVLPDFNLTDLAGKKWRLADWKGKIVFVNFWATIGVMPERETHFVQKLYERLKDDEDVILQSFNLDYDLGRIEPFRNEYKLEYPVLLARDYVDQFKLNGPTRNWIIDREGIVRFEWYGTPISEEEWLKLALRLIEKVKAGGFDR